MPEVGAVQGAAVCTQAKRKNRPRVVRQGKECEKSVLCREPPSEFLSPVSGKMMLACAHPPDDFSPPLLTVLREGDAGVHTHLMISPLLFSQCYGKVMFACKPASDWCPPLPLTMLKEDGVSHSMVWSTAAIRLLVLATPLVSCRGVRGWGIRGIKSKASSGRDGGQLRG